MSGTDRTLTEERCREVADLYVAYLNGVGLAVPTGPPHDPCRFHHSYFLDPKAAALRLEDGWAFPAWGNLTGLLSPAAVVVADSGWFEDARQSFLCRLDSDRPESWPEDRSVAGFWKATHAPRSETEG